MFLKVGYFSTLFLQAYQDTESEHESVVMRLYKLKNINASSVRTVMVASCREVVESDDTTKGNKRVQNNLGNQGGESSSKYAKTNIDQKLLGTINYKQEYRDAEKGHSQSVSHNVDMTETTLHGSHGNYTYSHDVSMEDVSKLSDVDKLVEITTKCVSLTSESDSTPVDAKVGNNCINLASDLISSNLNIEIAELLPVRKKRKLIRNSEESIFE